MAHVAKCLILRRPNSSVICCKRNSTCGDKYEIGEVWAPRLDVSDSSLKLMCRSCLCHLSPTQKPSHAERIPILLSCFSPISPVQPTSGGANQGALSATRTCSFGNVAPDAANGTPRGPSHSMWHRSPNPCHGWRNRSPRFWPSQAKYTRQAQQPVLHSDYPRLIHKHQRRLCVRVVASDRVEDFVSWSYLEGECCVTSTTKLFSRAF